MKGILSTLLLSIGLITPVAMKADHDDHHSNRYYDRDSRDWHEWNDREDRAYRQYLNEQHREYRDMAKANRKEQREYWRWRHKHPDSEPFRDGR